MLGCCLWRYRYYEDFLAAADMTAATTCPAQTILNFRPPRPKAGIKPADISLDGPPLVRPSLRHVLREATQEIHQRLHRHAGFAAVAAGDIDLLRYRHLLSRLYGFHRGIEHRLALGAAQSAALAEDLVTLGMDRKTIERLPRCTALPAMDTQAKRLGALYVIEGAALGGRVLARGLDRLLGTPGVAGRQFFAGQGSQTGAKWQAFLAELERCCDDDSEVADAVTAAQDMFAAFEIWLNGWDMVSDE